MHDKREGVFFLPYYTFIKGAYNKVSKTHYFTLIIKVLVIIGLFYTVNTKYFFAIIKEVAILVYLYLKNIYF